MKKSLLLIILLSVIFFSCKKNQSNKTPIDTLPKLVDIEFINDNIQSGASFKINDHTYSALALNGADQSSKERVQVKIGDIISISMFTTLKVSNNYAIKIWYGEKELLNVSKVVFYNNNNRIDLTHTFTSEDFK